MKLVTELKDSLFNDDVADLCIDLTEIGIDSVMDDGVLSEVPIAKTIVALSKTGLAIRERNMLKQTLTFIRAFNSETISDDQLQKYKDKMTNNKYAEKELGRVLYLLDRNIDNVKSAILGKIFNAYVNGKMEWDKFCELSEVNRKYIELTRTSCYDDPSYQILSNLIHGRLTLTKKDGVTPLEQDIIVDGSNEIKNKLGTFTYDDLLLMVSDEQLKHEIGNGNDYSKVIAFRLLFERHEDAFKRLRIKEPATYKYINETNHIENDYVFQLDPMKFYSIPTYYLQKLTEAINEI